MHFSSQNHLIIAFRFHARQIQFYKKKNRKRTTYFLFSRPGPLNWASSALSAFRFGFTVIYFYKGFRDKDMKGTCHKTTRTPYFA